jgi:hypothetical protein
VLIDAAPGFAIGGERIRDSIGSARSAGVIRDNGEKVGAGGLKGLGATAARPAGNSACILLREGTGQKFTCNRRGLASLDDLR